MRSRTTFFSFRAERILLAVALALLGGCYSFSGGGGFPSDIRTIYIAPFENQTSQFDLEQQVFSELTETLPRALGVRPAGEDNADAIVRGRIIRYDTRVQSSPIANPNQPLVNMVEIVIAIELIDVRRNLILWESTSLSGQGTYRAEVQDENVGRQIALEQLSQKILDGAQQQW
jgi:hypothetical protein